MAPVTAPTTVLFIIHLPGQGIQRCATKATCPTPSISPVQVTAQTVHSTGHPAPDIQRLAQSRAHSARILSTVLPELILP